MMFRGLLDAREPMWCIRDECTVTGEDTLRTVELKFSSGNTRRD